MRRPRNQAVPALSAMTMKLPARSCQRVRRIGRSMEAVGAHTTTFQPLNADSSVIATKDAGAILLDRRAICGEPALRSRKKGLPTLVDMKEDAMTRPFASTREAFQPPRNICWDKVLAMDSASRVSMSTRGGLPSGT